MCGPVLVLGFLFNLISLVYPNELTQVDPNYAYAKEDFVFWPNGTVPFYIHPEHFDPEQTTTILRALSLFAFMTCLKFTPAMAPPGDEHVLHFQNPTGGKHCAPLKHGHVRSGPHIIHLGYECLVTPMLERLIMRALGFPWEHNRIDRDQYVAVQMGNIEPTEFELFTKDSRLPDELMSLPYDVHSAMHFGEREFSRNGHRTIIFKDPNKKQSRSGLSSTDLKKIEIVYGPECIKRDRQEKTDLCRAYPYKAINRRKRSIEENKSLRVNPDITPPPEIVNANHNLSDAVSATLKELGISAEVQSVIDDVYKITAKALKNARRKYCNETASLRQGDDEEENKPDILGVIEVVANYTQAMVDNAIANMSTFCEEVSTVDKYQSFLRFKCSGYVDMRGICRQSYRSTKSGRVAYSTQHRPVIKQSTWHVGGVSKSPKDKMWRRSDGTEVEREKREVKAGDTEVAKNGQDMKQPSRRDDRDCTDIGTNWRSEIHLREKAKTRSANDDELQALMARDDTPEGSAIEEEIARRARDSGDSDSQDSDRNGQSNSEERSPKKRWTNDDEEGTTTKHRPHPSLLRNQPPGSLPTTVALSKKNEEFYEQRRWPRGVVRYMIDRNGDFDIADVRSRLDEVNELLKSRTCVRLEEIWERDANKHKDYLILDHSPDFVTGRVGGKQFFGASELLKGGQHRQHAAMMVMAMLGFYFELSRHDRDKYVRVHLRHVRADKLHHFEKIRSDATLPLEYDFRSATHPAWQYWRKVGKTGIATVATYKDQDPDGSIMKSFGQHEELLSEGDYIKINSVYGIECMTGSGAKNDNKRDKE